LLSHRDIIKAAVGRERGRAADGDLGMAGSPLTAAAETHVLCRWEQFVPGPALQVERSGAEHQESEVEVAIGVGSERGVDLHVLRVDRGSFR